MEGLARRSLVRGFHDARDVREHHVHGCAPEPVLRAEVVVHQRLRHAGVARDAGRRRSGVPDLGEGSDGGREDSLASILLGRSGPGAS